MTREQIVECCRKGREKAAMSYLADDSAAIKARLEELAAEKKLALTGSSAPEQPKLVGDYAVNYVYGIGTDYDPA